MPDLRPGDPVVIDAGIAVRCIVPAIGDTDELSLMESWRTRGIRVVAPSLLFAESTSALRRLVHGGVLSQSEGEQALQDLLSLAIDPVDPTSSRCREAFKWATSLGQSRAYDGFYLALAQELATELWTTDRRLANAARQIGVTWVRVSSEWA